MGPDSSQDAQTVSQVGEFGLIDRVTSGRQQSPGTLIGPGDDAAVLAAPDGRVVATTDVLVEQVHFRFDWSTPRQVGRKAVAVNLSDIAAMGAVPTGLLVGLGCSQDTPTEVVDELSAGMWEEAQQVGIGLVGGDMVSATALVISVTALGDLQGRQPVTRSGARPGDVVAVAGRLGWAAAGLAVLGRGFRSPVAVVGAQRVPEPPYAAGPLAAEAGATSMVDISDGLLADLGHIATASGVAVDIRNELLEVPQRLSEVASALGADARHWVLTGGEDQALAATFPPEVALPEGWRAVGVTAEGQGVTVDGAPYEGSSGWEHWR
ncbi:thiamine-phosphate kinase [Saccharopolyspora erythraea NRRL 2338]|uniref:Thiamine-monophosphate kinase n=4 Tax=Saccharopolyspora erythraea TaxID=1836 RepID=A4FMM5_SACEN|nr:thiamine-phosphate kinase [Saccharopolyspora erythraea]PFG98948.1 thiamine-phosphate kinase [Saccharopolyspora erythraea NRRL 2338]QRK88930.1 thiamine-phosphate kinase [Saccharopolyspora erythraea]CAM05300.1 putative thiamine monophosphate kinase [Saccharopolyspora erythraea NRRL 2338]